jgi:hypothetical protein
MTDRKPTSSWTLLSCMPVVVMAVVAVTDIVAGPGVGFLPLVSLGPAFAGLVGGWRRTAWFGFAALLLRVALGLYDGLFDGRRGYTALASVAGVTGAGVAAAVMRSHREAELASVRSIAEVAQRVLLRPVPLTAGRDRPTAHPLPRARDAHPRRPAGIRSGHGSAAPHLDRLSRRQRAWWASSEPSRGWDGKARGPWRVIPPRPSMRVSAVSGCRRVRR